MDWSIWLDKKVYIKLKEGFIIGKIVEVDDSERPLTWIKLINDKGKPETIIHSEIIRIREFVEQ